MFITVEYGEGQNLTVNPDCTAVNFIDYIRKGCGIKSHVNIDICDENSQMYEIYNKDPQENLFDIFMPRSTFLLVQTDLNPDGSVLKITPMMNDWEKKYQFLERKLKQRDKRAKQAALEVKKPNGNDSKIGLSKKRELSATKTDNRRESNALKEETPVPKKSFGKGKKK